MKKIKVLRIIARLNIGGPAIQAILLTGDLNRDLFESLLVAGNVSSGESDMLYLAREKDVDPIIIPGLKREISFKDDLIAFFKLYRIMRKYKPDIVHTHTAKAGFLGRIAACVAGVPCRIHTFHGHVFHSYFSKVKSSIFVIFERILSCYTDKIIAVSHAVREELLGYRIAARDKIEIIPLGLELDKLVSLNQKNKTKKLNVGIIGRLTKVKNHKLFLRVARKIQLNGGKDYEARFIIIGDGELKDELINYANILDLKNVEFKSWIKDTVEIYQDLDIVALTSFNEGTPVSLIEAMAAAKPVIATKVGGVKDLLNPLCKMVNLPADSILIDSDNLESFERGLSALFGNEVLRLKLGEAGREFVRKRFTKERLINDTEKLYNIVFKRSKK